MVILYLNITKGKKKMAEKNSNRPFHETIIEAIRGATIPPTFILVVRLIQATKIPAGHDGIIKEIDISWDQEWMRRERIYMDAIKKLKDSILKQKAMAEAEAAEKETKASAEDKLWVITGAIEQHGQESLGSPSTEKNDKLYDRVRAIHRAETKDELQAVIAKL